MESLVLISKSTEMVMESKEDDKENSELFPGYRRIDFQPAKKQFTGFTAGSSSKSDFRIETLNPRKRAIDNNLNLNECSTKKTIIDRSDLKENGLDSELTFRITFRKIGAGLENVGNTCFLNSVLQCLTYTEPLAAYLQSGKHQTSCRISGFCALCAIQKHVIRALQSTGRSLVPKDLVTNLRCISRNFKHWRQQDAHEYMVNLLESMHKCCLPSGVPTESPAAYEKSLVHKIFGGRLRSQVECQQCRYSSNKFDPFLDLSLDIVKADTLSVALRNFTAAELLDGGGKQYQCQKCKQKVRAKKRLTIHDAPNVLAIHLKRFYAHDPGRKIDKKVSFNPSLDMKPFVTGSYEGDLKYSLYGVLVHYGHNTHSGHYVCYVRTSSGAWHYLNDHNVRLAQEQVVLEQKAYMLFYVRDQKKIPPRNPGDAFQKENLKHTIRNNFPSSVFKQTLKEHVIGSTETLSASVSASASVVSKDFSTSKEIPSKKESDPPASDCSASKANPTGYPSSSTGLPSKEVSLKPDGECLPASASFTNGKCDVAVIDNVKVPTGVGVSDCDKASSDCDKPQNSPTVNMVMSDPPEKINLSLNERVVEAADKDLGVSQSDFIHESCNKVGVIPNQNTAGNSLGNQTGDSGQQIGIGLANVLVVSVTPNESPEKAPDRTPHKKSKRLLKHKFSPMHLSLKIFRPSIGLRLKNHKKCRRKSVATKNLMKEQLLVGISSLSDIGPSASEMSVSASSCSSRSQKVRVNSHSKCGGNTLVDIVDEEFKKRTNGNGDAADMDEQLKSLISVTSEINQHKISLCDLKETDRENASGLQETTVARWDGIELLQPQIVESNSVQNSQIGYIPDEWDEEYDRGKRKKVRQNKHDFGGSNPFQDFASEKTDYKRAKMDSSSSGNQPFRI